MELSANYLLTKFKGDYKEEVNDVPVMHFGESRENFDQVPVKRVVIISDQPSFVVLYNSLAQERMQVVSVHVSEPYLEVCNIMSLFCFYVVQNIGDKVFKNGPSKFFGRQPLKNLKGYGLPKTGHLLQIFKRLSSTNFTWSIIEYFVASVGRCGFSETHVIGISEFHF